MFRNYSVYQVRVSQRHRINLYEIELILPILHKMSNCLQGRGRLSRPRHPRNIQRRTRPLILQPIQDVVLDLLDFFLATRKVVWDVGKLQLLNRLVILVLGGGLVLLPANAFVDLFNRPFVLLVALLLLLLFLFMLLLLSSPPRSDNFILFFRFILQNSAFPAAGDPFRSDVALFGPLQAADYLHRLHFKVRNAQLRTMATSFHLSSGVSGGTLSVGLVTSVGSGFWRRADEWTFD